MLDIKQNEKIFSLYKTSPNFKTPIFMAKFGFIS